MVNDNQINDENPKKRSRLFGGRKADSAPAAADAPEVPTEEAAPEAPPAEVPPTAPSARKRTAPKSAATHVNASTPASDSVAVEEPDAVEAPVAPKTRSRAKKAEPVAEVTEANDETVESAPATRARPTTSLLFQAPDLPPLPPLPRSGGPLPELDEPGTVRRRSRRRPGEDLRPGDEAPNTVVRVRQPRPEPVLSNEPTRVKGSTRLEAKKQRRRESRQGNRRRHVKIGRAHV